MRSWYLLSPWTHWCWPSPPGWVVFASIPYSRVTFIFLSIQHSTRRSPGIVNAWGTERCTPPPWGWSIYIHFCQDRFCLFFHLFKSLWIYGYLLRLWAITQHYFIDFLAQMAPLGLWELSVGSCILLTVPIICNLLFSIFPHFLKLQDVPRSSWILYSLCPALESANSPVSPDSFN